MTGQLHPIGTAAPRRSDAGIVRFGQRDITGLVLCAEHYGACYRHDYLVTDRRSTATLIRDGEASRCFHTQIGLSRSVIGSADPPGGGSKQIESV